MKLFFRKLKFLFGKTNTMTAFIDSENSFSRVELTKLVIHNGKVESFSIDIKSVFEPSIDSMLNWSDYAND